MDLPDDLLFDVVTALPDAATVHSMQQVCKRTAAVVASPEMLPFWLWQRVLAGLVTPPGQARFDALWAFTSQRPMSNGGLAECLINKWEAYHKDGAAITAAAPLTPFAAPSPQPTPAAPPSGISPAPSEPPPPYPTAIEEARSLLLPWIATGLAALPNGLPRLAWMLRMPHTPVLPPLGSTAALTTCHSWQIEQPTPGVLEASKLEVATLGILRCMDHELPM